MHLSNRTHNIGYHDNLTDRPRTTTGLQTPHKHTDPAVKLREISSYCKSTQTDSKTIQETNLTPEVKTPKVHNITTMRNIIPHTWKLVNIVPIPKPNKNTDKDTSYRSISLISLIAKTLEKSLLPYITANMPNTPMHHGYKTHHSTVMALHTLNNTVAKGFNQMAPPARTITVVLDMRKAFDTINMHTLIRKLRQRNIPGIIIKLIANYIKGRKAYTTYRNHTSTHVNLILAFHKAASFHTH